MLSWDLRWQVSSAPKNAFTMPSKMTLDRVASVRPRPQNSPIRCLPPYQPVFPKILQKPRKCATLFLTNAIRARGPAATRHFATNENRLPILLTSPQPCPAHCLASCQVMPHPSTVRISQRTAFSYVSDRPGSSEIVSDRPGSSERTAAHRPPFPQNCRNVRPIPPAEPAKKRVKTRRFASKYAPTRPRQKTVLD